jgi:hypothetical protein
MTRTTLLFQSRAARPARSTIGLKPVGDPQGAGCAAFLADQLSREGVTLLSEQPYWGEGGWSLDIAVYEAAFTLCFHWLPLGSPPRDFWVVQIRPRVGPLGLMLGTAVPEAALDTLREVLERIVKAQDPASELRWSTFEDVPAGA